MPPAYQAAINRTSLGPADSAAGDGKFSLKIPNFDDVTIEGKTLSGVPSSVVIRTTQNQTKSKAIFTMSFSIQRTEFDKIQMRLGRPISADGDKLAGYHELKESDLNDLRLLAQGSSIDATNFLLYCLGGKGGLANASSYVSRVVKGDMSPQQWLKFFYKAT